MASSYVRRFTFDPGLDVLLEIESINILDLDPEAAIAGTGTGAVCIVAEFEDGEFNKTVEVSSVAEVLQKYGGLGYTYAGQRGQYPSATVRYSDASVTPEYWNGNGHVAINGKRFARLMLCRVDTSVGEVYFTPLAYATGAAAFTFKLTSGQTLTFEYDGTPVTVTFTGVAATVTGASGTFPTTFTGGETLTLGYDDADDFQVTFLSTDQSVAQVVARINQFAGFTFAEVSSGRIKLTGRVPGTAGEVRVVSGSTGVLAGLGLTAATTAGTGNVANINTVTPAEVHTRVDAASTSNAAVRVDSQGRLRLVNVATSGTGTLEVTGGTATALGFGTTDVINASDFEGSLPAGTRVKTSGNKVFVTMQTTTIVAGQETAYAIKVRHAVDDGTGTTTASGTVNVLVDVPDVGEFEVINLAALSACLTETQLDAAYVAALPYTLGLNDVTKEINLIMCARQSNSVRFALRDNALTASSTGHYGRTAVVRAPMGSNKSNVTVSTTPWGVAATRSDRVVYCYPQSRSYVPTIAAVGLSGGTGFTADGIIDSGADSFACSVMSQLPPEENPGQQTSYLDGVRGIETAATPQLLDINDYKRFKAAGIMALRIDNGQAFFQSGVTSVDKALYPGRVNIARRRMADYIQDSLAIRAQSYGKQLMTVARRVALTTDVRVWMDTLKNGPPQRIDSYSLDVKSGNTATSLGRGHYRLTLKVRTLSSFDSITIATEIGEQVTVAEAA